MALTCDAPDCSNPRHQRRRYCGMHCWRLAKHGTLDLPHRPTPAERFHSRHPVGEGCWEWTGDRDDDGYGIIWFEGKPRRATRVAWFLEHGEWPDGLMVLHTCDNPPCVRPDHLFTGTTSDNQQDSRAKGRNSRGEGRPAAKLTEAGVLDIRARYAAGGITLQALATEYGVSRPLIGYVVRREVWDHI